MKALGPGDPASVGDGRYLLTHRLGQGGMGVVYLGRSPSGRAVAVKVVRPELSTEPGFRRRFADEVAAARRVGGFHTAPVVDADPDGDPAWLVTAFVPGPTLATVLARVTALPVDTLTVLAAGLAEALEAIHRAGVIHRDFKPANIIIAEDGPRVIDFGIARALDGTALTQTGMQVGTPGFLSPEQLTGGSITPAVDMFALGVVLTQAAGGSPFGDGPATARHYKVVYEEPDLSAVPDELRELVADCLCKDPADRPTSAEFLRRLTVRWPAEGWLPDAAMALLRRQDPEPSAAPEPVPSADATPTPSLRPDPAAATSPAAAPAADRPETVADPGAPAVADRSVPAGPAVVALPEGGTASLRTPTVAGPPGPERPADAQAVTQTGTGAGAGAATGAATEAAAGAAGAAVAETATGAGPAAGARPEGAAVTGAPTVRRPRRVNAVRAAAVLLALSAVGLLVWRPWSGSSGDSGAAGPDGPAASAPASPSAAPAGPAAFPTAPVLVRQDTAAGWPQDCHGVISRRDPGAAAPVRLTTGDACAMLPQWSPDRRSFAYTQVTAQGAAVWTAHADGSNPRRIAAIAGGRVSWSPDGTRLAVLRAEKGVQQLFVVNLADGSARQVTSGTGQVEDPAWSPDGKRIAFCMPSGKDDWQIHAVDADAPGAAPQQLTRLPHPALDPVWSPDGRTFAYTAGTYGRGTQGDIRVVGTDGTGDRALVATDAHEMDPAWSPDGGWLAFVRGPYEKPVIWAVRADGTDSRSLTTASASEGHPAWR
ncbi:protein kinase [Streptomyces sp. NPDC059851]|uniref:protein kinase domain-containing protein n=1 Tax=Streptomyces sp. NPDC059851 TaxID=3346971 RepID=UPI003659B3A6